MDIDDPIFTDANKAREHLELLKWPKGPVCRHCGEKQRIHRLQGKSHRAGLIQCNACLKNFTVTIGTIFERSKIPLEKWLLAVFLLSSGKKGVSVSRLHERIGVTYKTAWLMAQRIREAMGEGISPQGGKGKRGRRQGAHVKSKAHHGLIRLPAKKKS